MRRAAPGGAGSRRPATAAGAVRRGATAALLTASALLAALAAPAEAQRPPRQRIHSHELPLVLSGGTVIDGTGAPALPDAVVVVRDGRIAAVGRRGEVAIPSPARIIDVGGATILPGFINAHVHSGYRVGRLTGWAQGGVTTVRDLGGREDYELIASLNRDPANARLVAAGPFITVPGGYPIVPWGAQNVVPVTTAAEAADAANRLIDEGADIVKIAIETGAAFGRTIPTLSLEQARAIVQAAHARGTPVSVHLLMSYDLPRCFDAGVDDLAHMVVDSPSAALLSRAASQDVVWVPTLELWYLVGSGNAPRAVENLRRFLAAGGTVALGTDYDGYDAVFQLGMPILEMEQMQQAGMSAMQVIVAGTSTAARVCGLSAELGTVAAGKIADLVVVNGNPLADIHALANTLVVVHGGTVIRNELGPPPASRLGRLGPDAIGRPTRRP